MAKGYLNHLVKTFCDVNSAEEAAHRAGLPHLDLEQLRVRVEPGDAFAESLCRTQRTHVERIISTPRVLSTHVVCKFPSFQGVKYLEVESAQ